MPKLHICLPMQAQGMPYGQLAYNTFLAKASGPDVAPPEEWRIQLNNATGRSILAQPDSFRDVWPAEDLPLYAQAEQACAQMLQKHRKEQALRLAAKQPLCPCSPLHLPGYLISCSVMSN